MYVTFGRILTYVICNLLLRHPTVGTHVHIPLFNRFAQCWIHRLK